jgi:hypothetical protein
MVEFPDTNVHKHAVMIVFMDTALTLIAMLHSHPLYSLACLLFTAVSLQLKRSSARGISAVTRGARRIIYKHKDMKEEHYCHL